MKAYSGVVLNFYSSTKLLSLPQNLTNTTIHHTSTLTWSQKFLSVEKSKIVIRHSRNILCLHLHWNLKSFTRLPKEQTPVRYSTVQQMIKGSKPGRKGPFESIKGQQDRNFLYLHKRSPQGEFRISQRITNSQSLFYFKQTHTHKWDLKQLSFTRN